jgi:hypothetical protein
VKDIGVDVVVVIGVLARPYLEPHGSTPGRLTFLQLSRSCEPSWPDVPPRS